MQTAYPRHRSWLHCRLGYSAPRRLWRTGSKNCTKIAKASWKPASEAEAAAKAAGYEVRKSKVEGSC